MQVMDFANQQCHVALRGVLPWGCLRARVVGGASVHIKYLWIQPYVPDGAVCQGSLDVNHCQSHEPPYMYV